MAAVVDDVTEFAAVEVTDSVALYVPDASPLGLNTTGTTPPEATEIDRGEFDGAFRKVIAAAPVIVAVELVMV